MTEAITWSLNGDNAIHILDAIENALAESGSIIIKSRPDVFELTFPLDPVNIGHFKNILGVISLVLSDHFLRTSANKGRFSDLKVDINNSGRLVVTLTR